MKRELILLAGSQASAGLLKDVTVAAGYELSIAGSQEEGLRIAQEGGVSVFLVEAEARFAELQRAPWNQNFAAYLTASAHPFHGKRNCGLRSASRTRSQRCPLQSLGSLGVAGEAARPTARQT